MFQATVPTSTDAQSPDWRSVFKHAYDNTSVFEPGTPLPHSNLVSSLQATTNIELDNDASRVIRQAVSKGDLEKFPGELYPDEFAYRYQIKRDHTGTGKLRQKLDTNLRSAMRGRENVVIQSPTSSGKTHTPSTTRWRDYPDLTGGKPVVVLHGTTDARDDAIGRSQDSSAAPRVLHGRKDEDGCPLARGDYDSDNDEGNTPVTAPGGSEPSEWFETMCNDRGLTLSFAHGEFVRKHPGNPPCCAGDDKCPSSSQWGDVPRNDTGEMYYDVLHTTHEFARVPRLIENCNVIIDEEPDFKLNIPRGRVRKSITSYLQEIDAPVETWEHLVTVVRGEAEGDRARLRQSAGEADPDWFMNGDHAHALTPGIVQAILDAEERGHGRWVGQSRYTYPDLIPGRDSPDHEVILLIVFDSSNEVKILQAIPDFSRARCVIGLDAHPTEWGWRANTLPSIETVQLVDNEDLHGWRRKERNLKIVQVGDNKYSWTNQGFNEEKVTVLCDHLRRQYEEGFQSGITSKEFKDGLNRCLEQAGVDRPETIHFGNEKSVNTFKDYPAGLVAGCISPSDDNIKDWLALLDKDATPKREAVDDYQGQEYVGPDSDVAEELVAAVREKRVLQACGRYARSPMDPDDGAAVYVLTNVLPDEYVDEIEDVRVFGEKERQVLDCLCNSTDGATVADVTGTIDATRQHVNETLKRCRIYPWVQVEEDAGPYNANVYHVSRCPEGVVDV